jgi:hypothetical protein
MHAARCGVADVVVSGCTLRRGVRFDGRRGGGVTVCGSGCDAD